MDLVEAWNELLTRRRRILLGCLELFGRFLEGADWKVARTHGSRPRSGL